MVPEQDKYQHVDPEAVTQARAAADAARSEMEKMRTEFEPTQRERDSVRCLLLFCCLFCCLLWLFVVVVVLFICLFVYFPVFVYVCMRAMYP